MKAILKFDLNEPDDIHAHKRAVKALDMALVLWDIDQYFRSQLKYNEEGLTEEAYAALEKAREKFYEVLGDHNVNIDEMLR